MRGIPQLKNLGTETLLAILESKEKELQNLQLLKNEKNSLLDQKKNQLQNSIYMVEEVLFKRFEEEHISLQKLAQKCCSSMGKRREFYQEAFTKKITQQDSLIDNKLLEIVLNQLKLSQLIRIVSVLEIPLIHTIIEEKSKQEPLELEKNLSNLEIDDVWKLACKQKSTIVVEIAKECLNQKLLEVEIELSNILEEKQQMDQEDNKIYQK